MARARNVVASPPPPPSEMNIGGYEEDNNDKNKSRGQFKWTLARGIRILLKILRIMTSLPVSAMAVVLIVACLLSGSEGDGLERASTTMKIGIGYLFVAKPLLSTLDIIFCYTDLGEEDGNSKSRKNSVAKTTRLIAISFLMSIVCNQLPKWLSALVACLALFFFGLASRQVALQSASSCSKSKQTKMMVTCDDCSNPVQRIWSRLGVKERAVLAAIILVIVMLTENFAIWVVSATYQPGMVGSPKPLQDNGRVVLEKLAMRVFNVTAPWMARRSLQRLRDGLNVQWALVTSFGTSLVCLELRLGQNAHMQQRTLAGLALHALVTLALARLIRTISFSLTVLPSQVNNCYASHFPPPPEKWSEWLMIGFLPNSRGGCNDLILSGHATITSTITCAFTSAASNTPFSIAVWTLVALDYSIEAYQGLHYSVDMWLGCIVTCLLWQLTKPFEFEAGNMFSDGDEKAMPSMSSDFTRFPLDMKIVGTYALPATVAFVALTMVPEAFVNYFLVGYSVLAGIIFSRCGFTSFVQHVLLCELCLGLGAYL